MKPPEADGQPRLLAGVDAVPGVDPGRARHDHEVVLPGGATLLLYTDGLAERRHDDGAGTRLLDPVRAGAGLSLPEFCDHLVRGTTADTGDDIVVLAVRLNS
ncbi:MAG: serine/threonine-protein phosphatase [Pseudonocardia sp.]|nr:serine/threonine-protein phosphatase [Pseudonocardia sp.]